MAVTTRHAVTSLPAEGRPLAMEAPPVERRLAAILTADVEGYSRLMHGDEEATMVTLSARRAVVDDLIAQHRGRIANTV
jgi:adenylate cyclase